MRMPETSQGRLLSFEAGKPSSGDSWSQGTLNTMSRPEAQEIFFFFLSQFQLGREYLNSEIVGRFPLKYLFRFGLIFRYKKLNGSLRTDDSDCTEFHLSES